MKHPKLRIAWSVTLGLGAVLVALYLRSFHNLDSHPGGDAIHVENRAEIESAKTSKETAEQIAVHEAVARIGGNPTSFTSRAIASGDGWLVDVTQAPDAIGPFWLVQINHKGKVVRFDPGE